MIKTYCDFCGIRVDAPLDMTKDEEVTEQHGYMILFSGETWCLRCDVNDVDSSEESTSS